MKTILYLTNLGNKRNINGQTEKAREIYGMLHSMNDYKIITLDKSNPISFLKILILPFYNKPIIISCLGINGLKFLNKITYVKKRKVIILAVGGWILDLIKSEEIRSTNYLYQSTILTESEKIRDSLRLFKIQAYKFPNFRTNKTNWQPKSLSNLNSKPLEFIYIGRVIPSKGINILFELSEYFEDKGMNHIIKIYGPIAADYKTTFTTKLSLSQNVSYFGTLNDRSNIYSELVKTDFFLFPTSYPGECVPGSVIESLSVGTPVICNNWRFMDEVIKTKKNGLIIDFKKSQFDEILEFIEWCKINDNYKTLSFNSIEFVKESQSAELGYRILSQVIQRHK